MIITLYSTILIIFLFNFYSFDDASTSWQIGFQDLATSYMDGISNFHNIIMFFIMVGLIFIFWLLFILYLVSKQLDINFLIEVFCFIFFSYLIGIFFFYQKITYCAESTEPFLDKFLEDLNNKSTDESGTLELDYEMNSRKSSISIEIEYNESTKINTASEKTVVESRPQSWWEWFFGSPKHTSPPDIVRTRESIKLEVGVAQLPPNKEKFGNPELPRSYKTYFNISKISEREEKWTKP